MAFFLMQKPTGFLISNSDTPTYESSPYLAPYSALVDAISTVPSRYGKVGTGSSNGLFLVEGLPSSVFAGVNATDPNRAVIPVVPGDSRHSLTVALRAVLGGIVPGNWLVTFGLAAVYATDPQHVGDYVVTGPGGTGLQTRIGKRL